MYFLWFSCEICNFILLLSLRIDFLDFNIILFIILVEIKKNCFDFFYKKILRGLRQSRKSVPFSVIVCEKIFFVSCFRLRSSAHVPFCPATTNVSSKQIMTVCRLDKIGIFYMNSCKFVLYSGSTPFVPVVHTFKPKS